MHVPGTPTCHIGPWGDPDRLFPDTFLDLNSSPVSTEDCTRDIEVFKITNMQRDQDSDLDLGE